MAPGLIRASPRLDPSEFPRRIEVVLSDEVVQKINSKGQKTGNSLSEVATDIPYKAVNVPYQARDNFAKRIHISIENQFSGWSFNKQSRFLSAGRCDQGSL
jgi:hypothetical protein